MTKDLFAITVSAVLLAAAGAPGAERGIHISKGRPVSSNWNMTDGAGFRWDIYVNHGQVNDGTNDAYDGGMQLQVNGSTFNVRSPGRLSADGREIEIGPWPSGSVNVSRRIYVDPTVGYCRWIDIFANTSSQARTLTLRYYSNVGAAVQMTYTTGGKADLRPQDWGIVTSGSVGGSRPAIVHVFAGRNAKVRPQFQYSRNSDNLFYHHTLKIPPKRTVALCLIEAQRRPYAAAQKFLKEFRMAQALKKVPPALRRIIVNMRGGVLTLGSLELPRNEKFDLVVQPGGNELLGSIGNQRYVIETFYGEVTLAADRIVGLHVPAGAGGLVRLGLTDGQVVVGRLLSSPIRIKLANGSEMSLALDKIDTAAYRFSGARPEEIAFDRPMVVLRSGQQLFFRQADADWTFHTQYGRVKLTPGDLKSIVMDTPDGGLHRAVFRNGSVLSGLLACRDLNVGLDLGGTLEVGRQMVREFAFPAGQWDGPEAARMFLRNDDVFVGRIADDTLKVDTGTEQVTVRVAEIAQVVMPPDPPVGRVRLRLRDGSAVEGRLLAEAVAFQITPGPKLPVYVGHISEIVCPQAKPATGEEKGDKKTPATAPVESARQRAHRIAGELAERASSANAEAKERKARAAAEAEARQRAASDQ